MIILDTNVLSETLRPVPDPKVLAWLDAQADERLVTTAITAAELLTGMELMPEGRRKENLRHAIAEAHALFSDGRILPFDLAAATCLSKLSAIARLKGHGITVMDAQIAAIAMSRDAAVATRDVGPFLGVGLRVINPWEDEAAQK